MNQLTGVVVILGSIAYVIVYVLDMYPKVKRYFNNNALAITAQHRQLYADEMASLVEGWSWKPGYQSHFVAHDGTLIPTCNVSPWASTPEDMMDAYWNQVAIIRRYEDGCPEAPPPVT